MCRKWIVVLVGRDIVFERRGICVQHHGVTLI